MEASQGAGTSGASSSSDFVRKLYKMLEDPAYEKVVRWGNDGSSFVVLENETFTKSILPKHFKHSNFASFVRQLNKYDFHKVRHNNEESGQSPYGANAWEFKHPEFRMNGKEGLENIRRKAPATRKVVASQPGDDVVPPAQMDLFNSQMVAMQQQLQNLSDRYSELNMQNSILLSELNCMQKTLLNHEQLMQSMLSYVQRADPAIRHSQRLTRANAAFAGNADPASSAAFGMNTSSQNLAVLDAPLSPPLRNAERIFNELAADAVSHQRNLTQLNELYRQANGQLQTAQPESALVPRSASVGSGPPPPVATEAEATLDFVRLNSDLHDTVYPAGHNHGIDPMFSEHIPNIPYSLPPPPPPPAGSLEQAEEVRRPSYVDGRKKSTSADPGWIRPPQILLVEDDPTCRRIGGKFLYSFKCAIDTAFDGLEAVNKMNGGSKYDLVLLDIVMPVLDGVSACHLIRQFDSTPIIAMTSNIRSDDIAMYFAHGMNDVLPKPFTKEGLLTMLEKHLGHLKDTRDPDTVQLSQLISAAPTSSTRQSVRDDSSSAAAKSPSTGNWQSPPQAAHGISPKIESAMQNMGGGDDYSGGGGGSTGSGSGGGARASRGAAGPYGLDPAAVPPPPPPPPSSASSATHHADAYGYAAQPERMKSSAMSGQSPENRRRQIGLIADAVGGADDGLHQPQHAYHHQHHQMHHDGGGKRQRLYPPPSPHPLGPDPSSMIDPSHQQQQHHPQQQQQQHQHQQHQQHQQQQSHHHRTMGGWT